MTTISFVLFAVQCSGTQSNMNSNWGKFAYRAACTFRRIHWDAKRRNPILNDDVNIVSIFPMTPTRLQLHIAGIKCRRNGIFLKGLQKLRDTLDVQGKRLFKGRGGKSDVTHFMDLATPWTLAKIRREYVASLDHGIRQLKKHPSASFQMLARWRHRAVGYTWLG